MRRVFPFVLCACVTAHGPAGLEAASAQCDSFAEFEPRIRAASDQLVAEAPSDELMAGSAQLDRARRQCARHTLNTLLGRSSIAEELAALARSYSLEELKAMAGPIADEIEPMLAQASALSQKKPSAPTADDGPACEAVERADPKHRAGLARKCIDSLNRLSGLERLRALEALRDLLEPSGARTETLIAIETVKRQLEATVSVHLQLAQAANSRNNAAQLHRLVAAHFGGPAQPSFATVPGRWARPSWKCPWQLPALPPPGFDAELRVSAACAERKAPSKSSGDLATFDMEPGLESETATGTVIAVCRGRAVVAPFSVPNLGDEVVRIELARTVDLVHSKCREIERTEIRRACETLGSTDPLDAAETFSRNFLATGHWEQCFLDDFTSRYGINPELVTATESAP